MPKANAKSTCRPNAKITSNLGPLPNARGAASANLAPERKSKSHDNQGAYIAIAIAVVHRAFPVTMKLACTIHGRFCRIKRRALKMNLRDWPMPR